MAGRLLLSASLLLAGAWSGMGQATSVTEVGSSVAEDNGTRHPALYSQEFNDCLDGRSLINLTEFDVAYYPDESTVTLRLGGMTDIQRDDTMLSLTIDVYGKTFLSASLDPCGEEMSGLCPVQAGVPIDVAGIRPTSSDALSDLPSFALSMPDVQAFARLSIISNSSQSEIGCFHAQMTNGFTLSHRESVGVILQAFVFLDIVASFAPATYGLTIMDMRTHYAHTFSALVVWDTFQSIFMSGALSVQWPSVLPAWWSNYAFAAGMVANDRIIQAVGSFTGSTHNSNLPLPGTRSGFDGTLSSMGIPHEDAFIIAVIWFVVALLCVVFLITLAKLLLDLLVKMKALKSDGFNYFRSHWLGYVGSSVMRTLFIGYFVMVTLAIYQLALKGRGGPQAVAAVVLAIFVAALGVVIVHAYGFQIQHSRWRTRPDLLRCERSKLFNTIPFVTITRQSTIGDVDVAVAPGRYCSMPFFRFEYKDSNPNRVSVHLDDDYVKRLGWLYCRYRRTRWWFFKAYLVYQCARACFLGGASEAPLVQVYGLFVIELLFSFILVKWSPFEGHRNTVISVWLLSFSKLTTTGLAIALMPRYNLDPVSAMMIGLAIVVVHGAVTLAVLVLSVLGWISSWISLSRNTHKFPAILENTRADYLERIERLGRNVPGSTQPQPEDNDYDLVPVPVLPTVLEEPEEEIEEPSVPNYGANDVADNGRRVTRRPTSSLSPWTPNYQVPEIFFGEETPGAFELQTFAVSRDLTGLRDRTAPQNPTTPRHLTVPRDSVRKKESVTEQPWRQHRF